MYNFVVLKFLFSIFVLIGGSVSDVLSLAPCVYDSINDSVWYEMMNDLTICGSKFGVKLTVNETEKRFEFMGDENACWECAPLNCYDQALVN